MYVFGIDVGGTNVKLGLFNDKKELLDKWSIVTNKNSVISDIANSILEYCKNQNISKESIIGYGIGIPGLVANNIALNCVNLNWKNIDVVKEFQKEIGYDAKVIVANDANLAAFGEYSLYDDKYKTIIFITLGTGVGGGVITNGQIVEGANGLSGEIGHIILDNEFKFLCSCGRRGCLETIASATGILRLANYFLEIEKKEFRYSSAKEVIDDAKLGNELAIKAVDIACLNIAKAFSILSVAINPDAYIIGGGVSAAGEYLLEKIKHFYLLDCFENAKNVDIIVSKLRNDAGIYGCATLILKELRG